MKIYTTYIFIKPTMSVEFQQIIQELTPYMTGAAQPPPTPKTEPRTTPKTAPTAAPQARHEHTLFWCCYILAHGLKEYMTITTEARSRAETEFRYEWLEKMNAAPKKTKTTNHKITNAIVDEIKTNVLTAKNIGIIELISFCVFYNKSITIITDKIQLEIIPDDSCGAPEILRYNPATKKYKIVENEPACARILVEQYNKPMVGISNYSVEKLKEMSAQLSVAGAGAAHTKKELYDLIYVAISTELPPARGD